MSKGNMSKKQRLTLGVVLIFFSICCISGAVFLAQKGQTLNNDQESAIAALTKIVEGIDEAEYSGESIETIIGLVEDATHEIINATTKEEIDQIKEDTIKAIEQVPTLLVEARIFMGDDLKDYVSSLKTEDYSEENMTIIKEIEKAALDEIEGANSEDTVMTAYDSAISQIEMMETLIMAAKDEAIAALDDFYGNIVLEDYSEANKTIINKAYSDAKSNIELAISIENINKIKEDTISKIQAIEKEAVPADDNEPEQPQATE